MGSKSTTLNIRFFTTQDYLLNHFVKWTIFIAGKSVIVKGDFKIRIASDWHLFIRNLIEHILMEDYRIFFINHDKNLILH